MRSGRTQRGFVLIQALIVIAALLAFMAMLAADQRATTQDIQNHLRQRRADAAADAAVAQSLSVLQDSNTNLVELNDTWGQLGDNGDEAFDLGGPTFRMQIVDAGSLMNINSANQQQLSLLPIGSDQIDSLLDWRETGSQARSDGAKDEYYNALSQPYNTKLGPLTTVNELLLVKGWTTETLYQTPTTTATTGVQPADAQGNLLPLAALMTVESGAPNTQADGTARVNFGQRNMNVRNITRLGISQALAATIAARAPFTNFRGLLSVPGVNTNSARILLNAAEFSTTARAQGKINLNTVTQSVLMTIPTMTSDIATAIITQQTAGFSTLGDLTTITGMTQPRLTALADSFTVGSDTWIVRAYGESNGVNTAVEALVGIRNQQVQILTWDRQNTAGIPAYWDWNDQASETVDAGSAS